MFHRIRSDPELILDASTNELFACDYPGEPYQAGSQLPTTRLRVPSIEFREQYESGLQHLVLTITDRCTLRCSYCAYTTGAADNRLHREADMSIDTAVQATRYFLDHSKDTETPSISFYGGEPLLNFPVIEAVVHETRERPETHLTVDTNGTLLDAENSARLWNLGVHLQLSLDGPRWVTDKYRGHGTFDRVMAGVAHWLHLDPDGSRLMWSVTIAPPYPIEEVAEFCSGLPGETFARIASLEGSGIEPDYDTLNEVLAGLDARCLAAVEAGRTTELPEMIRNMFDKPLIDFHHRPQGTCAQCPTIGCCAPGIRKLHVTSEGRLQPCERVGDHMDIGSVSEGIDLAKVDELDRRMFDARGDCDRCWAKRICRLCYMNLLGGPEISESECVRIRQRAEAQAEVYFRVWKSEEYRSMLRESTLS